MSSTNRDNPNSAPAPLQPHELAELADRYVAGELSDQQRQTLEAELLRSSDARTRFVRFVNQICAVCEILDSQRSVTAGQGQEVEDFVSILEALDAPDEAPQPIDITDQLEREKAQLAARQTEQATLEAAAYEAQARRLGLAKDGVEVHKRIVIPTPIFYGGIAAAIALTLMIGYALFRPLPEV
ncbi:MAG: hypothetical protein MI741_18725, partial [Rhodospirillales bacterium]|nr:hypothetical protein [Rhodospirillales bacterium]